MLTLDRRDCFLGLKSTTDGDEATDGTSVKTLTLALSEVLLDARELNALLCEPHAWEVLFNTGAAPIEPYLKSLKVLELAKPIEKAHVTIEYGLLERVMAFTECKLSKIKLEPRVGGQTALSCKVTAIPVLDESLAELFEQLGKAVYVQVRADLPDAQQDLALNNFGEGEQPQQRRKGAPVKRKATNIDGELVN